MSKQMRRLERQKEAKKAEMPEANQNEILAASCATFDENDIGNADRLCSRYSHLLTYAGDRGGWIAWDGKRWNKDNGQAAARQYASETARKIREEVPFMKDRKEDKAIQRLKFSNQSGKASSIRGMLELASPTLLGDINNFNDPEKTAELFNVQNGTVDLTTGAIKPHDPDDKITTIAGVAYDEDAEAPRWERYLLEVFQNDTEMVEFIQRAVGYSLFGTQYETVCFFLLGDENAADLNGSNGKSVFLKTLRGILGDYGEAVDPDLIVKRDNRGISNDIAKLWRVRVGFGAEFDRTDIIDEARLKKLTGDDPIEARFLHKEYFTFTSGATLFYTANHAPLIQSTNNGIWRRPVLIPFKQRFYKPEECPDGMPAGGMIVDRNLVKELEKEKKGILAWAIRGAVEYYQRGGLDTPQRLFIARDKKRAETDPLFDWAKVCIERTKEATWEAKELWQAYEGFCKENATQAISQTAFGRRLREMGIDKDDKESQRRNRTVRRGARLTNAGIQYLTGQTITHKTPDLRAL